MCYPKWTYGICPCIHSAALCETLRGRACECETLQGGASSKVTAGRSSADGFSTISYCPRVLSSSISTCFFVLSWKTHHDTLRILFLIYWPQSALFGHRCSCCEPFSQTQQHTLRQQAPSEVRKVIRGLRFGCVCVCVSVSVCVVGGSG